MAILKIEPVYPIHYTGRISPWSPFCLRVEEGPSWTGRTIDPISYSGKPLTYSLFRENQSLVSFLSESGGGSQLDRGNHWPYLLYRETFNFIHCSERTSPWSESGGGAQLDRENHWPYLLYRETFNLFTVQREPVSGLLSVWEWRWGPGGQGEPLTLIQGNI